MGSRSIIARGSKSNHPVGPEGIDDRRPSHIISRAVVAMPGKGIKGAKTHINDLNSWLIV